MKNQYTALFINEGDFYPETVTVSAVGLEDAIAMIELSEVSRNNRQHLVAVFMGEVKNLIAPSRKK